MGEQIGFSYGIMASSLEEQAKEQGYTLGGEADTLEKIRHAINMCGFHVATPSQTDSMFKKLHKKIKDNLIEIN